MPHFYPKHLETFDYKGRWSYALTFCTDNRVPLMREPVAIDLVVTQLRRASREKGVAIVGHCIMPEHAHLVVDGERDDADCRAFIKAAKQYSGYYYKQRFQRTLWQRYGFERVIRSEDEWALTLRYLLANPVRAGIVLDPRRFPGVGSEKYTLDELMEVCQYRNAYEID